jgi:hypothetical protein
MTKSTDVRFEQFHIYPNRVSLISIPFTYALAYCEHLGHCAHYSVH